MRLWRGRRARAEARTQSTDAQGAVDAARRVLADSEDRGPEVEALAAWLRRVRETNHFHERVARLLRAERDEGSAHGR